MYIEREIREKFMKVSKVYPVVALVGARQSGKTTFLREQVKNSNSSYLLFDDPDVKEIFDEDIKKFENQYIEGHGISVLDEIQYAKDAGKKLKYLADSGRKIWITSSSETILSKEVLSYLVGRVSIIKLYPFSLREILNLRERKEFTDKILKRHIWEHVIFGGYPKAVTAQDIELKKIILKDLYDTMILKDISRTFSIDDIGSLEKFTRYLAINIGNVLTFENISRDIAVSFQTLKKYIEAMEKSYLITMVSPFFRNKTKEITKQPKIYFVDTGLRNAVIKNFTEIDGKIFENYVCSELIKLGLSVKYWRTKSKAEVDFVVENEKEVIPIEVKTKFDRKKIDKSLQSFIETYKPKRAFIATYEGEKIRIKFKGCNVFVTNVLEMRDSLLK